MALYKLLNFSMNHTTEQLFGTLEVLSQHYGQQSLLWDSATQDEFSLWNLLISEGFISETDPDLAFEHWQNIERWGTPTEQTINGYGYAPSRSERKDDDWNDEIATQRQAHYHHLQRLLEANLTRQHSYKLSVPNTLKRGLEWEHPAFSVKIVVGEQPNGDWLCLAPTVPDQISSHRRQQKQEATPNIFLDVSQPITEPSFVDQFTALLNALQPITIFGYYHGGYNYSYVHRLVGAISPTQSSAIEQALQQAQMLWSQQRTIEYGYETHDHDRIGQFMHQCLRDHIHYSLSFWDIGYTCEVGKTPANDWIGVRSIMEFEYNP